MTPIKSSFAKFTSPLLVVVLSSPQAGAWYAQRGDNSNEGVICLLPGESMTANLRFYDPSDDDEGICQGYGKLKVREAGREIAPIYSADNNTNSSINIILNGNASYKNTSDIKECVFFIYNWQRSATGSVLGGSCGFHSVTGDNDEFRADIMTSGSSARIRYNGVASSVSGEGHADVNINIH